MILSAIVLLIITNSKENLREYDVVNYETIPDLFSHVANDYLDQITRDRDNGREASPLREWMRCVNSENGESFDMVIPGVMLKSFYGRLRYGVICFETDALYFRELDHSYEQERESKTEGKNAIRVEWRDFEHWLSHFIQDEDECQWDIWLMVSEGCKPTRYWKHMKLFFTQYPLRWRLTMDISSNKKTDINNKELDLK